MGRKTALFLAILTAIMLTACGKKAAEAPSAAETSASAAGAAATTVSKTETTAAEKPVVFSADEKYKYYSMEIIYSEAQQTDITAEKAEVGERFDNPDGFCVVEFSERYSVFASENADRAAVLEKINEKIKAYIDARYNGWKQLAENTTEEKDTYFFDTELYALKKYIYQVNISDSNENFDCNGYDICGNVLSVNFVDHYYGAGGAHSVDIPMIMMFDLTTGDLLNIVQLVEDREGFEDKIRHKSAEYGFDALLTNDDAVAEKYNESVESFANDTEMLDTFVVVSDENNYRYGVKNGCICFYLAPFEYGSGEDGIRRVEIPISEMLPFMNDEGKSLFGNMVSATTEPVMVMSENGEEKIISREQADELLSEGE